MRFVIVSFMILFWVFYEMSGGADFRPPERPLDMAAQPDRTARAAAVTPAPAPAAPALTRRSESPPKPARIPTPTAAPAAAPTRPAEAKPAAATPVGRITASFGLLALPPADPANPGPLVSLEQSRTQFATPLATFDPSAETETETYRPVAVAVAATGSPAGPDIREITGTRVNLRDGPGTIYPVVARLRIGQKVEVLDDSGTGWLRLRLVPGAEKGWAAAALVSKKPR